MRGIVMRTVMRRGDGGEEGSRSCALDKYQFTPIDFVRVLKMLSALNWAAVMKLGVKTSCTPDASHPRERCSLSSLTQTQADFP
jgi:hypothetical protein